MRCPNCGEQMLFCPTDGGWVCQCGYTENNVWEVKAMGNDWKFECQRCYEVFEFSEETGAVCPKCGCPVVRLAILQSIVKKPPMIAS